MVLQAIASQTLKDEKERTVFLDRLNALATLDAVRSESQRQQVQFQDIARKQLQSFAERVSIQGPPLTLDSMLTKVIALTLHEWMTNAIKHGALSPKGGTVVLSWSLENGELSVTWREFGGPPIAPSKRTGQGLVLIDRLAKAAGGGSVTEFNEESVVHKIRLPLPKDVPLRAQI